MSFYDCIKPTRLKLLLAQTFILCDEISSCFISLKYQILDCHHFIYGIYNVIKWVKQSKAVLE